MFGWGKSKAAKEMDEIIKRMQLAFENNYKDNATSNLKTFEQMYQNAVKQKKISTKESTEYGDILASYQERLKNFDHKKPAQW